MSFLAKSDLYLSILEDELNEITRGNDALVTEAINVAEGEALTYLYDSYVTEDIFSASGTARNSMVVQVVRDIAVYRIVAPCQAGIDLNDKQERFDAAIAWLRMVKKQETYPNLPRRTATKETKVVYGSKTKRNNYFG